MGSKSESTTKYFKKLAKWKTTEAPKKSRIVRVFLDTHMGFGHRGLESIASNHKVDVNKLERGELVVFLNRQQTAMKVFAAGNTIAHLKMPGRAQIDMGVIKLLPSFFTGSQINYKGALTQLIRQRGLSAVL